MSDDPSGERAQVIARLAREEVPLVIKDLAAIGLSPGEALAFALVLLAAVMARVIDAQGAADAEFDANVTAEVTAQLRRQVACELTLVRQKREVPTTTH